MISDLLADIQKKVPCIQDIKLKGGRWCANYGIGYNGCVPVSDFLRKVETCE